MKEKITKAVNFLKKGKLVAFPTETVYGLGADAENGKAISNLYNKKNRPLFNPLICHFENIETVKKQVIFSKNAKILAENFWPGPLTIILKKRKNSSIHPLVSSGLKTIACRVPSNKIALSILKQFKGILAAPSANKSSKLSPTQKNHVIKNFGKDIFVIDGGSTTFGIESTVIDLSNNKPIILRAGAIDKKIIKQLFPDLVEKSKNLKRIKSPGQLKKHYSPNIPIRINVKKVRNDEVLLNFGKNRLKSKVKELNLSKSSNLEEAAKNLFKFLHILDNKKYKGIAVAPIVKKGLGIAINDRLERAAFSE